MHSLKILETHMTPETLKQVIDNATNIRAKMRASPRLQLEFKATISKLFREHNIDIDDETLAALTIATPPELSGAAPMVDNLPVPDLGPVAGA